MTEILSLCNSSSQTCPPRVSTTALPINSAAPTKLIQNRYRTALHPMALLVRVGPSPASQRRGFVPRSAPGTIDGERSSSFRSRSICVLSLSGWSGSGFSASRNFSPISLAIARRCLWSMSMRRGTTDLRAYPFLASPPANTAAVYKWNRRPPLLAICASACIQNSGPLAATFGYPAICAVSVTASGGLVLPKP